MTPPVGIGGRRRLGPVIGLPAPLTGDFFVEAATGRRGVLLRLPPPPSPVEAGALLRELTPASRAPLLLHPSAIEVSPAGLAVLYPLPEAHPAGRAGGLMPSTLADLMAAARSWPCGRPELLALLVLEGTLAALRVLHARGESHALLAPGFLVLAGAAPRRLLADCPRDPAVRLLGFGVARRVVAATLDPAPLHGGNRAGASRAAADLRIAATLVRDLLIGAMGEPAATAAPQGVAADLHALLARLSTTDSSRRQDAARAASECRALALRALADWERSRDGASERVRYAAPPRWQGSGGGKTRQRRSPAGLLPAPRAEEPTPPEDARLTAGAWERSDARAEDPPQPQPLPRLPAGAVAAGPAWLALAPSLFAGLLVLLLAVTLRFGP